MNEFDDYESWREGYEENQYPSDWANMNNVPYEKEVVKEPTTCIEWFEAVIVEIIYQTGRTLVLNDRVQMALQGLVNIGASPGEAASALIRNLKIQRIEA